MLDSRGVLSTHKIDTRKAEYAPYPDKVSPLISNGLKKAGIKSLYMHQTEAILKILNKHNVIVASSTASGKSMTYSIPILNSFLENSKTTSLYLTPAKALGQDQRKNMQEIADKIDWPGPQPQIKVCDGDTPFHSRRDILQTSNVVISTIDMLHFTLIPQHSIWKSFFANLKYVCIDEAHNYRGVFGSGAAQCIRRLRRICHYYGSDPVFVLCTATIGNPYEFACNLVGEDFAVIDYDTSPSGAKELIFYEPPQYVKNDGEEARRLTHYEAARALGELVDNGKRVITFGRSRRIVESMYRKLGEDYPYLKNLVTPYKGTYTPEIRRETEQKLFGGKLFGVMSTSALELGIDVGDLDVCILSGLPGSISSTWQQAGRVGRKSQDSTIIIMANEDPLDLYLINNPEFFLSQQSEKALVNPSNHMFLLEHLQLAAQELPLTKEDSKYWDKELYYRAVKFLYDQGNLLMVSREPCAYKPSTKPEKFSLRGKSGDEYRAVTEDGEVLEKYDLPAMLTDAYPGAIVYTMGKPFLVDQVDMEKKIIVMQPLPRHLVNHNTRPYIQTQAEVLKTDRKNEDALIPAYAGTVKLNSDLKGYYLITPNGDANYCSLTKKLKPYTIKTAGMWLELECSEYGILHALEHLLNIVIPWFAMCERNDIITHIENNCIYVADNYPGGVGQAESMLDNVNEILKRCYDIVDTCTCLDGCPACLNIPKCAERNTNLNKEGVIGYLASVLGYSKKKESVKETKKQPKSREELRLAARELKNMDAEAEVIF